MVEIICAAISGVCAIVVAVIGVRSAKAAKAANEREIKAEKRQELRDESTKLMMRQLDANTQLTQAIGNAVLGGHNNGNVERAQKAVADCLKDYDDFVRGVVAHEISK